LSNRCYHYFYIIALIASNEGLHRAELAELTTLVQALHQSYFGKSSHTESLTRASFVFAMKWFRVDSAKLISDAWVAINPVYYRRRD
jgi:hypothetical protein